MKVTRSKTGPDRGPAWTGPDRTGPIRSGPRSIKFSYSVLAPVPVRTGGPVDRIKWVARSCPSARPDRAPKKIGGTAVPCGTVTPCHFSTLSIPRTGPVRSGPGFDRSGPVLGPDLDPYSILGPDRSSPVRSDPGPNYSPNNNICNLYCFQILIDEVVLFPNTDVKFRFGLRCILLYLELCSNFFF